MKDEKEKNIFHSISSFFSSFFPDAILGWSLNQPKKKKGSSWRLTILPFSVPLSPVLPSLQIKIFLLILHPPFLKGLGRVGGKKLGVEGIVYVVTNQMAASFNGFLEVKENFPCRSHEVGDIAPPVLNFGISWR